MKKYKVPVDDSMIKLCDNRERAIAITPDLLESDNRPDGFFAINDETASGILYACKLVGLKVPDEVSICGFTDGAIAQSTDPKLTTVAGGLVPLRRAGGGFQRLPWRHGILSGFV